MDYFDADVAYLVGLIVARGQLIEQSDDRRIIIEFPASTLTVEGVDTAFDQAIETKLGLVDIAFRLRNLLETDVDIISSGQEGSGVPNLGCASRYCGCCVLFNGSRVSTGGVQKQADYFGASLTNDWVL